MLVGNITITALIDTGATISCISKITCDHLTANNIEIYKRSIHPKTCILADGTEVIINYTVSVPFIINKHQTFIKLHVLTMNHLQIILGCDLLEFLNANINYNHHTITIQPINKIDTRIEHRRKAILGHIQEKTLALNTVENIRTDPNVEDCLTLFQKIDFTEANINNEQKSELKSLISQYRTIFAEELNDIGTTHLYEYDIKLKPNTQPIRLRPYKTAWHEREIISEQVQEWLDANIIVPSDSEWAFPCLLTKKKNTDKLRLCCDYRLLNKNTELQSYPMLDMNLFLADLGSRRCKYFTVLDLRSAFLQIPLSPRTQEICTFVCHEGAFKFLKCPFGLSNIPLVFSRLMDMVFKGIKNTFVHYFIDDIIITSETYPEHCQHIKQVFERLRQANLTLEPKKAFFFRKTVTFLGHKISENGISTDDSNIDKVKNFAPPNKVKDVRSFLGLCNYYKRFIQNYSKIASPLQTLVRKNIKFQWNNEAHLAFEELKIKLTTAPVLALPNMISEEPLILTTDASTLSVGFILSQKQFDHVVMKKVEKVICYGGRALTEIQSKYTITELELFACLHGITKLDSYLRGKKFTLVTDHAPLKWLFNKDLSNVKPRLARWIVALQMYNFEVIYKPGLTIPHVDFLSRQPYTNAEDEITFKNEPYLNTIQEKTFATDIRDRMAGKDSEYITMEDIRNEQHKDHWFKCIYSYLRHNHLPKNRRLSKRILEQHQDYMIIDKTLYHLWRCKLKEEETIQQLCIPQLFRCPMIKAYHDQPDFGHFGHVKTLSQIQRRYFWNGMNTDISNYIQGCTICAEANAGHSIKAPLKSLAVPTLPFQVVHIDILSISTPSSGYKYIVLIVDAFSKYVIGRALKQKTSKAVSKILFEDLLLRVGFPETFIVKSDNGLENLGSYTKTLHALLNIDRVLTTPYSPSSNGQVEIYNRTLLNLLRKYCHNAPSKWSQYLQYAIFAMNSSTSDSSKYSPIMLTHGIETRSALDLQLAIPSKSIPKNQEEAHAYWKNKLDHIRELAQEHLIISKEIQKTYYDRNSKPVVYKQNDKVFLKEPPGLPHTDPKLRRQFTGPWTISKIISPTNVLLTDEHGVTMKRSVHVNKLKTFKPRNNDPKELSEAQTSTERRPETHNKTTSSNINNDNIIKYEKQIEPITLIPSRSQDLQKKPSDENDGLFSEDEPTSNDENERTPMDNAPDESYFNDDTDPVVDENTDVNDIEPSATTSAEASTSREVSPSTDAEAESTPSMSSSSTPMNIPLETRDANNFASDGPADHSKQLSGTFEPIKRILRQRVGPEGKEYYVKWQRYPAKKYNSWVKEQDLKEGDGQSE